MYLLPSPSAPNKFYGVVFLRRGLYQNGVFKFNVEYEDGCCENGVITKCPKVMFHKVRDGTGANDQGVPSPLIDRDGMMDMETMLGGKWDGRKHILLSILTYVKKLFYLKNFERAQAEEGRGVTDDTCACVKWYDEQRYAKIKDDFAGHVEDVKNVVDSSQIHVYESTETEGWQFGREELEPGWWKDKPSFEMLMEAIKSIADEKKKEKEGEAASGHR